MNSEVKNAFAELRNQMTNDWQLVSLEEILVMHGQDVRISIKAKVLQKNLNVIETALNRLDELEAKETPKKPKYEKYFTCSVCGEELNEYRGDGELHISEWKYCPECGQKLDWGK